MTDDRDTLGVVDTSGLTDADWAEINKIKRAYDEGGQPALSAALEKLSADPSRHMRVMGAFFPHEMREAIRDEMAEIGMTEEDLRELVRKLESPTSRNQ